MFTWSDGALTTDERYDGRTNAVEPVVSNALAIVNVSSLRESDTGNYECHITYGRLPSLSTTPLPPPLSPQSTTVTPVIDFETYSDDEIWFRLDVQGELCVK